MSFVCFALANSFDKRRKKIKKKKVRKKQKKGEKVNKGVWP